MGKVPTRTLTETDAAIVRALLDRKWAQHDVASLLGCNPGRIAEIATRARFPDVPAVDLTQPASQAHLALLQNNWSLRVARQLAPILSPSGALI